MFVYFAVGIKKNHWGKKTQTERETAEEWEKALNYEVNPMKTANL